MQANWIGRSEGCDIAFPYAPDATRATGSDGALRVFTTRADTLMGVTFMAVAAEHPLALAAARGDPQLAAFIEECRRGSVMEADVATQEKKGMPTGLHVLHPFTGEPLEVWVANYVLMAYGEGAVMGVPAHDERDFEFALKNDLPITTVVRSDSGAYDEVRAPWIAAYCRARRDGELRRVLRPGVPGGGGRHRRGAGAEGPGPQARAVPPARLGHLAPALLGLPDPAHPLRGLRRGAGAGASSCRCVLPEDLVPDGSGNPLAKSPAFYECACPKCGAAGAARDRHHGHLRRLVLVLHALRLPGQRARHGR